MKNNSSSDRHHNLNLLSLARQTMIDEGFNPDMPADVEQELKVIEKTEQFPESGARDLRNLLWSSIDNLTSRDLDQVEYVERRDDGSIKVLIGIADVDAFVAKNSAIDIHAS